MIDKRLIEKFAINFDYKVYDTLEEYCRWRIDQIHSSMDYERNPTTLFQYQGQVQELKGILNLKTNIQEALKGLS